MSEGLNEEMLDETVRDGIMSELHREEEFAAERFASALDSAERGHPLDQRDLEDAALAPMVNAAVGMGGLSSAKPVINSVSNTVSSQWLPAVPGPPDDSRGTKLDDVPIKS